MVHVLVVLRPMSSGPEAADGQTVLAAQTEIWLVSADEDWRQCLASRPGQYHTLYTITSGEIYYTVTITDCSIPMSSIRVNYETQSPIQE